MLCAYHNCYGQGMVNVLCDHIAITHMFARSRVGSGLSGWCF
jgi:hypothetical protein